MDGIASADRGTLVRRMIGAARLDAATYEEVEADRAATWQAAAVVAVVVLASAVGGMQRGESGISLGLVGAFVLWLVGAGVVYFIGTQVFEGTADWGEMLRTMGFAQSPGVLYVLAALPVVGDAIRLVVLLWILAAMVVAIRQALDFSTANAVLTSLVVVLLVVVALWSLASKVASAA